MSLYLKLCRSPLDSEGDVKANECLLHSLSTLIDDREYVAELLVVRVVEIDAMETISNGNGVLANRTESFLGSNSC